MLCVYSKKPLQTFYFLHRDTRVMDLFLLNREHRCGVTVLLLSAVKLDKDSGKVRVLFENDDLSLTPSVVCALLQSKFMFYKII